MLLESLAWVSWQGLESTMTIQEAANLQNDGAAGKACKNNTTHEHAHWQNAGTGAQNYLGENVKQNGSISPYSITSGRMSGGQK